jgi:hypothetical protein
MPKAVPVPPPSPPSRWGRLRPASWLALAIVGTAAIAVGCANVEAPGETGSSAAAGADVAAARSVGAAVDAALGAVTLRPEQRDRMGRLRVTLRGQGTAIREAKAKLRAGLVAEVEAEDGVVRTAALALLLDGVAMAVRDESSRVAAALDELHETLDAGQRSEIARAMRASGENGGAAMASAVPAYGPLWTEIGATPQQEAAIVKGMSRAPGERAPAAPRGQWRRPADAVADAFERDTFDARELPLTARSPEAARADAETLVEVAAVASPVLDARKRALMVGSLIARWRTE